MNKKKRIYYDIKGNQCSLYEMIGKHPEWAAGRIRAGEDAIEELKALEKEEEIRAVRESKEKALEILSVERLENDLYGFFDIKKGSLKAGSTIKMIIDRKKLLREIANDLNLKHCSWPHKCNKQC